MKKLSEILDSGALLDVSDKETFTAAEAVDVLTRTLREDADRMEGYTDEDFVLLHERIDAIEFLMSEEGRGLRFKCVKLTTTVVDE